MTLLTKIRHRIGKWIWKENEWTKAVDEIESAVDQIRRKGRDECMIRWHFKFLAPPNKFTCHIRLSPEEEG